MDRIAEALAEWGERGGWLLVLAKPQSGKSTAVRRTLAELLAAPRGKRACLATYSADCADLQARRIRVDHPAAAGTLTAVSVNSPVPHPQDVLIVDDPIRTRDLAQSQAVRDRVWSWWRHEALPSLAPDGQAAVVQAHWHEDDLAGRLLATEPDRWETVDLR